MSNLGFAVVPRTPEEIRQTAVEARRVLLGEIPGGRLPVDAAWLLEKRVAPIVGIELDIVDSSDGELQDAHAVYSPFDRVIRIRDSVLRNSALEEPEALFTIFHELGHVFLHSKPKYFRRLEPNQRLNPRLSSEWQADRFAMEFAVDRSRLTTYTDPVSAGRYFRLPVSQMRMFFGELRSEGVLQTASQNPLDCVFDNVEQEGFDF